MLIIYCEKCGVRVNEEDLNAGFARKIGEHAALCPKCTAEAPPPAATKSASQLRGVSRAAAPRTGRDTAQFGTSAVRAAVAARPSGASRPAANSGNNVKLFAIGVGVLAAIGGMALLLLARPAPSKRQANQEQKPPEKKSAVETKTAEGKQEIPPVKPPEKTAPVTAGKAAEKTDVQPLPGKSSGNEMEDFRNQRGQALLKEAQDAFKQNPDDIAAYFEKLDLVARSYRSTTAGPLAAKLLDEIKTIDGKPILADEGAWKQAVDLMPLIDPSKDSIYGTWKLEGGELKATGDNAMRIEIAYEPPEEYDFLMTFTRLTGFEDVNQFLAKDGHAFFWSMAPGKNCCCGFDTYRNTDAERNPSSFKSSPALDNNRKYTSLVQVRKHTVRGFLDGKLICEMLVNYKDFGIREAWKMRRNNALGVGCYKSHTTFHSLLLREVTGKGKSLR
ncbi:MAG TPA: hypothetical protein VGP72_04025 [Planctomycetota bacterium]|jgi:hypothetical protein